MPGKRKSTTKKESPKKITKKEISGTKNDSKKKETTKGGSGPLKQLEEALKEAKVNDLLGWMKDSGVITIESDTTIYSALMILIENKITSAPVKSGNKYTGFISMHDLVATTVEVLKNSGVLKKKAVPADVEDEFDYLEQDIIIDNLNAKAVSDFAKLDEFLSVKSNQSAWEAAITLKDSHHCAVVDAKGVLVGVLTQSSLIEYIAEEHALIVDKMKDKVKDLNIPKEVYSVTPNDSAVYAFKLMVDKKVSGLAIVEKDHLIDAISVRDLTLFSEWVAAGQVIHFHNICALASSVKKFLETSRGQRGIEKKFPVSCQEDTPLSEVMSTMLTEQVHRIFVVDDTTPTKLDSVVTYGNIISYLLG